jgi:hypothetical protein
MPTKAWIEAALAAISKKETELDFSGQRLDAGDLVSIASTISSKALLKVNISYTDLCAEGGTILAAALDGNQMMTELNIANNCLCLCVKAGRSDMLSGIIAIANSIKNMGAMTKFNISSNNLLAEGVSALAAGLTGNQVITELNISGNELGVSSGGYARTSGVFAVADAIKDMRALSIANVMGNSIGKEMHSKLQEIMRSKPNLISLCGIADDATEADLSGLGMDADDTIILASELPDKGVMTTLILKENRLLNKESGTALRNMLKSNTVLTKLDVSDNGYDSDEDDGPGFAQELAIGIKGNRALSSLNLAANNLGGLVLPDGWRSMYDEDEAPWIGPDGQEQDKNPKRPLGVIAIANVIPSMRALSILNISSNDLRLSGCKALALAISKSQIASLDVSNSHLTWNDSGIGVSMEGIIALADVILDMGALSKLIFGGDGYNNGFRWVVPEPATLELGMTKVDLSNKGLQTAGAIIVAAWISHKDKGAMTSLNLASNCLGNEGAKIIAAFLPKCM